MNILHDVEAMIGNTPMVRLNKLAEKHGCHGQIFMKLEYKNPGGSIKDRIAKSMIDDAEQRGLLKRHSTSPQILVEATSGNTGIGLALIASMRGYKLIIVMPENMSEERKKLIRGMGAELVLTSASGGVSGANEKAEEIVKSTPGAMLMRQFANPANPDAHYKSTGPEIWQDCKGKIDYFMTGVGTGGTVSGVARYLKQNSKTVKVYGIEPAESPLISQGKSGPHLIQGIGPNVLPETLDQSLLDGMIQVKSEDAIQIAKELVTIEGVVCGISSGANAYAAIQLAKKPEMANKRIVTIACDTADRYLSTKMFEE